MKEFLGIIGLLLLLSFFWIWSANDINKDYEGTKKKYQSFVGEKVVVGKDTLLITDYSIILSKFYLENGVEISKEFAEKKIVREAAMSK